MAPGPAPGTVRIVRPYREHLEAHRWFADRGGFGLVDMPDVETVSGE